MKSESEDCSVVSDSLWPHGLYSPWNSPGPNSGVGSLSLLQGIFPTQGSNPGLPHCWQILYQLSHKGSPRILEWVAYPSPRNLLNPGVEHSLLHCRLILYQLSYQGNHLLWNCIPHTSLDVKMLFILQHSGDRGVYFSMSLLDKMGNKKYHIFLLHHLVVFFLPSPSSSFLVWLGHENWTVQLKMWKDIFIQHEIGYPCAFFPCIFFPQAAWVNLLGSDSQGLFLGFWRTHKINFKRW